ncbi:hypothetical protein [Blastococcus sp. URHD0036]|uniref:hypothetical protein n=1 Tax=Blastococcus sp. URHD0036 TaxID=1380356 RepID=UPI000496275D|nr:hypothetical protein [Blastococcus sp. URHD0036]
MTAVLSTLRDDELDLLRETEPERMAELDEDETLELHTRIRRARTKYVKLYRRQASARVEDLGGRGFARPKNRRNADKAEVFEDALARVSTRVDVLARRAAAELREERLAAARATPAGPGADGREAALPGGQSRVPAHEKTTGGVKRDASSRAQGSRRQAARDNR